MKNRLTIACTTGDVEKILALAHRDYGFVEGLLKAKCYSQFASDTIAPTVKILRLANVPTGTWGSVLQSIHSEN